MNQAGFSRTTSLKRTEIKRSDASMRRTEMKRTVSIGRGIVSLGHGRKLDQAAPPKRGTDMTQGAGIKRGAKRMKVSRPKTNPIRQSARDEECTLRFPCCNWRTDTTVLCHRNGAGGGMKSADTDAAYGCYACHVVLDGQAPRPAGLTRAAMLAQFEAAILLTVSRMRLKGVVK